MNDKNTNGVRNCRIFLSTPSLLLMLEASGVSVVGLFLHENHVTSQGHAAYCDSLAVISVFLGCLRTINERTMVLKEYERTLMCFLLGIVLLEYAVDVINKKL